MLWNNHLSVQDSTDVKLYSISPSNQELSFDFHPKITDFLNFQPKSTFFCAISDTPSVIAFGKVDNGNFAIQLNWNHLD